MLFRGKVHILLSNNSLIEILDIFVIDRSFFSENNWRSEFYEIKSSNFNAIISTHLYWLIHAKTNNGTNKPHRVDLWPGNFMAKTWPPSSSLWFFILLPSSALLLTDCVLTHSGRRQTLISRLAVFLWPPAVFWPTSSLWLFTSFF